METKWKIPAVIGVVIALMFTVIPMATFNVTAASDETYYFYVDLTADGTLNGQWIVGTGTDSVTAFINAADNAYGAANNVITNSGWIKTLDGISPSGVWGVPGYTDFAQYGYVTSAWTTNAYLGGSTVSTNNQYAVFLTEYVFTALSKYVDTTGLMTESQVISTAEYSGTTYTGYTAVAVSATDTGVDNTWDVTWYLMPNAQVANTAAYVDSTSGYAQLDDTVGLATLANLQIITAANAPMSSSTREVTFVFSSTETSISGYDVSITYDTTQLAYVSASNLCDLSFLANGATAGRVSVVGSGTTGIDGKDGLFSVTFTVKDAVADTDIVKVGSMINSMVADGTELSGQFLTSYASVTMPTVSSTTYSAGKEVIVSAASNDEGALAVTFDTGALRFVSVSGAISVVTSEGKLNIVTASADSSVEITFAVVENPLVGKTTVYANGAESSFNIVASSFVIVPAVAGGQTIVSLYKVQAIAGFKMVFSYTGTAPTVTDLANISSVGSFSTYVDTTAKTLTVVWANSANVDLNGNLFSVSGMTSLTLTASNAELRSITDDLSSVRVNLGIASSLDDAKNQDPTISTDLNSDGATNLADLILLMQYLADYDVSITIKNADYTSDGVVDIRDAMALQEIITAA